MYIILEDHLLAALRKNINRICLQIIVVRRKALCDALHTFLHNNFSTCVALRIVV